MKRALIVGIVLAAFASLLFAAANRATPAAPAATITASQLAPDFALHAVDGRPLRLSDLRGKVVVLNFWATWCPPCRHEIPWFIDLQKKYGPKGLVVVGLSMDSASPAEVAQFAKGMGINYPIAMADQNIVARYGVPVLPTTIYIGRDGRVVQYVPGLIRRDDIEQIVTKALAAPASRP